MKEFFSLLAKRDFKSLFYSKTDNIFIQFFRYCFVGGIATVVDWGASYLLFRFVFGGKYAVAANVISFVLGLIVNYVLSTLWVFTGAGSENRLKEFLGFAAIGLVGLLLTAGITKLFELWLADRTSAYQILGKIVSTAAAFLWNFFARKYLLFNKNKEA
jgi:putative flippase GtrA